MSRWFRFYDDALNDPKVQKLPGDLFKAWVNILCLASKTGGVIASAADVAFSLRCAESRAHAIVAQLMTTGLLDGAADGCFTPHNWDGRQFKSDDSSERVKRHRERRRNGPRNVAEAADATAPEPDQTRAESEQTDSGAVAGATRTSAGDLFERFWSAYPRRDGANPRTPAEKKFAATVGDDPARAEHIIKAARRYADQLRRGGQYGTRFVAQAVTWLGERRWQDNDEPVADTGCEALAGKFHAPAGSPQLAAWDAHRRRDEGKTYPRDSHGGWWFDQEWPPGHAMEQQARDEAGGSKDA